MQAVLKDTREDLPWYAELASSSDDASSALRAVRLKASELFLREGFPSSVREEWKYTNLAQVLGSVKYSTLSLPRNSKQDVPNRQSVPNKHGKLDLPWQPTIVLENGWVKSINRAGIDSRLEIQTLKGLPNSETKMSKDLPAEFARLAEFSENTAIAFNTAAFIDAVLINVPAGVVVKAPIHILWITNKSDLAVCPRLFLEAGAGSQVSVVESYLGESADCYFNCAVSELKIGEAAIVEHSKLVADGAAAVHFGATFVDVAKSSKFTSHVYSIGGSLIRNEVHPVLSGEHCEVFLNGLTAIGAEQHVDNFTMIDHAKPNCFSRELYKGIYDGHSSGAFSGTIMVRQDAQKTNAIQSNRSILLSDTATVNTQPQLKIYADNVKCTHGATIGQMDDDALFYLRSRGIDELTARRLLLHAFAGEVLAECSDLVAREWLAEQMLGKI